MKPRLKEPARNAECVYTEVPALSRTDNETLICPDCGIREALESIGISKEEQEKIISIIHRNTAE